MMTLEEIGRLMRLAEQQGLAEFEFSQQNTRLILRARATAAPPASVGAATQSSSIRAPSVGIFRSIHPSGTERFIAQGVAVGAGAVVAFLQIGELLRPVTAPRDGVIGAVLVAEGSLVGYGTALLSFTD